MIDQGRDDGQGQRDLHLDRGAPPGRLSMSTVPPIFSTLVRTTSMPTPRPENCVTWSAVEKPGRKTRLTSSRSLSRSACSGGDQLGVDGLVPDALRVDALAVVGDLDDDLAPLVEGVQRAAGPRRACPGQPLRRAARCRGRWRCAPGASAGRGWPR